MLTFHIAWYFSLGPYSRDPRELFWPRWPSWIWHIFWQKGKKICSMIWKNLTFYGFYVFFALFEQFYKIFFFLYEVSFLCYRAFKKVQNFRILMVFATVNGIIIKNIIFFMICIGSLSNYWVNQGFVLEFQQFFSKCQKKHRKCFFLPYDQKWLKF